MGIVHQMVSLRMTFTWTLSLLALIYRELYLLVKTLRVIIATTLILQAWVYEHIHPYRPLGLPDLTYTTCRYTSGIRRWIHLLVIPHRDGV